MEANRVFQILTGLALLVGVLFGDVWSLVMIAIAFGAIVYACFFGVERFRVPARWSFGILMLLIVGLILLIR